MIIGGLEDLQETQTEYQKNLDNSAIFNRLVRCGYSERYIINALIEVIKQKDVKLSEAYQEIYDNKIKNIKVPTDES